MEFLTSIATSGTSLLITLVAFVVVLSIVVFFHELGHFMVARWNKVDIDAFAIGFGRELFGFNDKHGTRWKFCLIPLGGYVKFSGDANEASSPDFQAQEQMTDEQIAGSFANKRVGQRAAIVAAGPIANFILAAVIFAGLAMTVGRYVIEARITAVHEDSAAQVAGFKVGDVILKVDNTVIESFTEVPSLVVPNPGRPMNFIVDRDGVEMLLVVTPRQIEREDPFGNLDYMGTIGVESSVPAEEGKVVVSGPIDAIARGVMMPVEIIKTSAVFLKDVITGQHSFKRLGGPIKIAKTSGQVASLGMLALVNWVAYISVSIGFLNLLPIPPLDGGHLVFFAIEKLKGSPLSQNSQEMFFKAGFALVLLFMVMVTFNDIMRDLIGA